MAVWRKTIIQDLDNDGTNEVLTCLDILGEVEPYHSLRIYDSQKQIKRKVGFHVPFQYLNRVYSPDFGVSAVLTGDVSKIGTKEIFVIAANHNSPSFLARLDSHGNELGKYWHFGWFNGFDTVEVNNNEKPEIVLWGLNDVADSTHEEFGAIMVLDPSKVIGDRKSSATPGFRFGPSDAELYYIRLPRSDMDEALRINSGLSGMVRGSDNTLAFHVGGNRSEAPGLSFDFVFSNDMRILQVKSYNTTDRLHSMLAEQGKARGKIDKKYLEDLKNAVRYWDGKKWRKEVVRVNHDLQLAGGIPPK